MKGLEQEWGHSYWTIRKALGVPEPAGYQRQEAKAAPVLGPYQDKIKELLLANERMPGKQRYTSHKIYESIQPLGYTGAESTVRRYVGQVRQAITGGFADSRILQVHGERMVQRDFTKRAAITVQLKDMRNALTTAQSVGFEAPITTLFEQLFSQAVAHGLGNLDHSGLFVELAQRNGMR